MNLRRLAAAPILTLALCLAGCGWQLRGSGPQGIALQRMKVLVVAPSAATVGAQLYTRLGELGLEAPSGIEQADVVLRLTDERFLSRIVSFDPDTGKVREYELAYSVSVEGTDAAGRPLLAPEVIDFVRDYTFDDTAVLGAFSQDQVLRQEITSDAADAVLRKLQGVRLPAAGQAAP